MSWSEDKILDRIKTTLIRALNPKKIYIFGSRGRGDHSEISDYDLLVVVEKSDLDYHARNVNARLALTDVHPATDVFVITEAEFDEMKNEMGSIPELALHEGRELEFG
jgi:predicted nucleotidyltransferase